jgi:predicted small metal-binding protein
VDDTRENFCSSIGGKMARMIQCECGYQALGATDDEVLASIMSHIESVHPDRVGVWSSSDLLSMAVSIDE